MSDTDFGWIGPFKRERIAAETDLENGDNEIEYRGVTFTVNDIDRGWIYVRNRREYSSLDEVFDAIDAEVSK